MENYLTSFQGLTFTELIPKLGLMLSLFFAISPLPAVLTAIIKDKSALRSISIPGTIMGLSCSTSILAFCEMQSDAAECIMSCRICLMSAGISLSVYALLNNMKLTLFFIAVTQITLYLGVHYMFTPDITEGLTFGINLLSCVVLPLD